MLHYEQPVSHACGCAAAAPRHLQPCSHPAARLAQVCHLAQQADRVACCQAWISIKLRYSMGEMLVLDETSKNRDWLKRTHGWGISGQPLLVQEVRRDRGDRVSALCLHSPDGFEDWRMAKGTFNGELFNASCAQMLTPALLQKRPCVLIDNASIHHSKDTFVNMVRARGGEVEFLPPYAYLLSSLDNGAFGLVCRDLQANYEEYAGMPMVQALGRALGRLSVRSADPARAARAARMCWYNCGYGEHGVCPYA